jgi:HAE1 family hydrophobic/amphiphilic exporter-1
MNEVISAMEKDILETKGVKMVLSSSGGGFLGGVNQGGAYVRIEPHEVRTLSLSKIWTETRKGNPFNAFRGK